MSITLFLAIICPSTVETDEGETPVVVMWAGEGLHCRVLVFVFIDRLITLRLDELAELF